MSTVDPTVDASGEIVGTLRAALIVWRRRGDASRIDCLTIDQVPPMPERSGCYAEVICEDSADVRASGGARTIAQEDVDVAIAQVKSKLLTQLKTREVFADIRRQLDEMAVFQRKDVDGRFPYDTFERGLAPNRKARRSQERRR